MVKVAVAAPGEVAREVIDGLVASGKHEIILLARRVCDGQEIKGTTRLVANFQDKADLAQKLQGVHTVLSFVNAVSDPGDAQIALIDASVKAGVKRFAPSEWFLARNDHLPWLASKDIVRKHLEDINKENKVLEYTLFQVGMFMDYLAGPRQKTKHIGRNNFLIDHRGKRALVPGSGDHRLTYTAIEDVVNIVVKAIDYQGEWPKNGGINGVTATLGQGIEVSEKISGTKFSIEALNIDDLRAGELKSSFVPELDHPAIRDLDEATKAGFIKAAYTSLLMALVDGDAVVGDEWNRIFPHYKFLGFDEFISKSLS
ncbi:hypothetical protein QBC42DRAFT_329331 [Cladorrhinum samala]|uniref:NmrA-like domain-containing protein n=1 Tax=Cladorrhinum samala TaxID=585594 RepID=A0AAV9I455_9PEZI|nr:hypothetical protein QBC42DRAFT_329331 [Cladorrhinum samala]